MNFVRLVVFDIAGTIIEDRGEVLSAFWSALNENGISVEENQLKDWKGASKREVIGHFVEQQSQSRGCAQDQTDRIYRRFQQTLEGHYHQEGVTSIPGAEETFKWLLANNVRMATTSGFYRKVRDLILTKVGWAQRFQANICSTDVSLGRPAPFMIFRAMEETRVADVRQVINVGDTPLDLQAGTNAGVRGVVAVLTGTHPAERLQREQHSHIISSIADLPALLQCHYGVA